mmetsp:Transcript_11784/g.49652  ORF Transcript_11784/g.49652 Transcript_11784/m.49652 type:complete len:238 (+) Transcript_11784:1378-2091(+)
MAFQRALRQSAERRPAASRRHRRDCKWRRALTRRCMLAPLTRLLPPRHRRHECAVCAEPPSASARRHWSHRPRACVVARSVPSGQAHTAHPGGRRANRGPVSSPHPLTRADSPLGTPPPMHARLRAASHRAPTRAQAQSIRRPTCRPRHRTRSCLSSNPPNARTRLRARTPACTVWPQVPRLDRRRLGGLWRAHACTHPQRAARQRLRSPRGSQAALPLARRRHARRARARWHKRCQ